MLSPVLVGPILRLKCMDAQCISNTTRVCLKAMEKHFFLLSGLSRGRHWCCRRQATRPSYTATPEGTGRTSWPEAAGLSGTAPPGKGHSRPCPTSTCNRGPPRPTICRRTPGRWRSCYTPSAPPTRGRNRGGSTPPHWCGAPTRRSIYGPRGRETPSGPRTSWTSERGQSRTPAQRLLWRWPNGDSRTRSGWSACSARRTRTSPSATPSACRGPKPGSTWQTAPA